MLGQSAVGHDHLDLGALVSHLDVSQLWRPVLEPMLIGSLPPGLVCGMAVYAVTYFGIRSFRNRRLQRLTARAGALKSVQPSLGA